VISKVKLTPDVVAAVIRILYRQGNLPMNEFLIDCSFKQYSMALKFDLLIQRYAILILRFAA
jgi:hypothetical protein